MKRQLLIATVAALVAATVTLASPAATRYVPGKGNTVRISGTSTMHDWTMEGTRIDGELRLAEEFFAAAPPAGTAASAPPSLVVRIPVASITHEKEKMNTLMREALGAKAHPEIRYRLAEAALVSTDARGSLVRTAGQLTIKGTTRDVKMDVLATRSAGGGLVVTGELPIQMSDYGIKPPTAMLGTIKTGPAVKVAFRWNLAPGADGVQ